MGNYVILDKLGQGGMGVVYKARQDPLGREVAIKFLTTDPGHHPEFVKRFQREIEVCLRLEHPNIIKLYDAGERDGKLYYVMEYLSGARTLGDVIDAEAPVPLERGIDIAMQLLAALQHCHENGILHRDIKPANAMLTQSGRVILMDFGLVRDPNATVLTAAGHVVGTPRYLSPELLRGKEPGPGSDLWALGAVIYELLTDRQAFPGDGMAEITRGILREDPPPPSSLRPGLTPAMDAFVAGLLKKDPAERTPNARTGIAQLEELLHESGLPQPRPARRTTRKAVAVAASNPPERLSPLYAVGLVVLLAVMSFAGLRVYRARTPAPVPAASASTRPTELVDTRVAAAPRAIRAAVETGTPVRLTLVVTHGADRKTAAAPAAATAHKLAVTDLAPGTRYRIELVDDDGRTLHTEEIETPTALQQAERLRRAIEATAPLTLVRQFTAEFVKTDRRHPSADEARAHKDTLSRWQRRMDGALARHGTLDLAADFSPVRDVVFGAGGLPPADQRDLLEHIHDLQELLETMKEFGLGSAPRPALISARYGQVDQPALTAPSGAAVSLESDPRDFAVESRTGGRVVPPPNADDNRRMRGMIDPRIESVSTEFGASYRVIEQVVSQGGLPRCAEIHACFSDSPPRLGARILVANTPPATSTRWRPIAWLRPRGTERHVVYHTLPPLLLERGPIYLKTELMFSWAVAILERQGHQQVNLPWVLFAEP